VILLTAEIRRNLYKRGSSFETTIPMPLLFGTDPDKKYNVVFKYNELNHRWYVEIEEIEE
jgi:hypothetical protein